MTWISTSERRPAYEDGKFGYGATPYYGYVLVLRRGGIVDGTVDVITTECVSRQRHTHWAKLPDRPEEVVK